MSNLKGYAPYHKVKIEKCEYTYKKWFFWGESTHVCDYKVWSKQEVIKYRTKREKNIFTSKWSSSYVPVSYWDWVCKGSFKSEHEAITLAVNLRKEQMQIHNT